MTTLTSATPVFGTQFLPGPAPRLGGAAAPGPTGADLVRAIRQRLVMIILLWFFFIGATVALTLYMQMNYPEYQASSLVRVESLAPPDPEDPLRSEQSAGDKAFVERELQNQAHLIRSSAVLTEALQDPDLRRTKWFAETEVRAKEENERREDLLLDILSVAPVPDSNYLQVSASGRIKSEVATIVNVVVQHYKLVIEKRQKEFINQQKEQITQELERSQRALQSKKQEIEDFQKTSVFSEEVMQEVRERVLTLDALVTELDVELLGRKSQYETLQTVRPEDMPITAELQAILQNDPTLFQFEQRLIQAQEMLNQASRRYGPNHRIVRESTAQRDAADQAFRQDQAAKILHYQSRQIEQARRNYLEAQDQQLALREKLMTAKSEQRDMQVKLADYDAKVADQELLQLDYEKKLEQKNMLEAIYRQRQTVQVEVASIATPPERMSSPKLAVWIPAGTLLGLVVSVGLALLLELADKSVRTPRDVIRAHLPVLGTIPTTDDDEVEIERVETACLDAPHSIVAEAFRNLRANLFFSAPAEQQGVILVTSPSGGNGKTTVASNLAISIALSGRRVLLIDSNFRRAALPRVFPNMREEGLSNILIGQGELKDFVTPTSVPGLEVLSAGPLPPNPAELLGSSFLRDVVVDARSRYDQVIFDGPPVLLVSDAMVLAGAVDGVLLVCEYRNTSRGALQRTQANLEAINARIFGAVLNKVQSRAGGYFRRSYREFYEYHEPSEDAPPARPQLATKAAAASAAATLPTSEGPGSFGGSREGSSAPSTAELDWSDATDEAVAMPAVAVAPAEPPLATTIEESDIDVEQSEGFFRDVGEVPAPVAASIPDMRDIEDVDDFRMPTAPADRAEDSPRRTSWEPASPATLEEAFPSESGAAASYFDSESIVEVPDSEDAVSPAQPDQSVDREPWGLETAPPAQEIAPETTYLPDRAEELNPGSSGESARSAAEEIEDEIDLGDDLADLDSEEFRIDDKFNLDDDFEDPDQTDLRR